MDPHSFYDLIRDERFEDAHRWLDDELKYVSDEDAAWLHHRRTGVYLAEKRYEDAIIHLDQRRGNCGTITSVHDTLAMLYEVTERDALALNELETAPYDADQAADPLLVADAKFYRLYFRVRRNMPVAQSESDTIPADYETYLPADGRIRGALVRKRDIVAMLRRR